MRVTLFTCRALRVLFVFVATYLAHDVTPCALAQDTDPLWLESYRAKAESGDANAQYVLGLMYSLTQDYVEAANWYRRATEQGHAEAQNDLGVSYLRGEGVVQNYAEAAKLFRRAAEQGFAKAQYNLGIIYDQGHDVAQDYVEAVKWYRRAAEQGFAEAQYNLGVRYDQGQGVIQDYAEAAKWFLRAAEQGVAVAQFNVGLIYDQGRGVAQDYAEAFKWFMRAAEQGHAEAQTKLGLMYRRGDGVAQDDAEAAKWYRRAAEQGYADGQSLLGAIYTLGRGVTKDYIEAYVWLNLAAANGNQNAATMRDNVAKVMTTEQIAEAQRISSRFRPQKEHHESDQQTEPLTFEFADASGSGFFVTKDGYFVTNYHVVDEARSISIRTALGTYPATLVRSDPSNDLAILKVQGTFSSLYVHGSRGLRLADQVSTIGFPNPGIQGFTAKYTSGEVAALSGPMDDPRFLQISVSIQPGNSGGPLLDASGRVVGVVASQLDKIEALSITGSLPENVNYAIKGTILLGVLEAVPGLIEKLKSEPDKSPQNAAEVAEMAEAACGMVIVRK